MTFEAGTLRAVIFEDDESKLEWITKQLEVLNCSVLRIAEDATQGKSLVAEMLAHSQEYK